MTPQLPAMGPIHPTEDRPRLEPRPMEELSPACLAILGRIPGAGLKGDGFPRHVLGSIMHNPRTLESFLDFWVSSKTLMDLSVREQELVILRMACLFRSDYVWKHHLPVGREFGISEEEVAAVHAGAHEAFPAREAALLALTDELVEARTIRSELWERHRPALADGQVVDLVSLVAQYVFFALMNNALQVQVESGVAGERGLADF
jgi:4-carboxymuconolactone decarboxylase